MQTQRYNRVQFEVDAVQVADDNIHEVAEWCGGKVHEDKHVDESIPPSQFVKVPVHRPLNTKQTRAYVGDWVLSSDTGFKVYTDRAFQNSFYETGDEGAELLRNIFEPQEDEKEPEFSDAEKK